LLEDESTQDFRTI